MRSRVHWLVLGAALFTSCDTPPTPEAVPSELNGTDRPILRDITAEAGLDFVHENAMTGAFNYREIFAPGAALFDYDNDGDLDLYLVQGETTDRLYRNDLEVTADGQRTLRFVDVTEESGLAVGGYGMGATAADFNNDGWVDLYVLNLESNQLWRNQGDGTFRMESTADDSARWSVAAVPLDFDRDGWLDLFVANYVRYDLTDDKRCRALTGAPEYCGPTAFPPEPDRLLINKSGNNPSALTFDNVTATAGMDKAFGPALGAVDGDFNADGLPDLYVANDGTANQLWLQGDDGSWRDHAFLGGSALNAEGAAEAGMGVDAGDFDNDGDEDLVVAHLDQETNTLYRNTGGDFEDVTLATGLGSSTLAVTGFGAAFVDYDNDGWLDLFFVNGAVKTIDAQRQANDPHPLRQTNLLFHNRGDGTFSDRTNEAGDAMALAEVSRGLAVGDLDNDGDPDFVIGNNHGPARLLRNEIGQDNAWLGLRLVGENGRRDQIGAWVEVVRGDGTSLWRRVRIGGSYASARDPRLIFGLGPSPELSETGLTEIRVHWPRGERERFPAPTLNGYHTLQKGEGEAL